MSMMNETVCTYGEAREALLIGYLYNEMAVDERAAFGRHLSACALCRAEVDALRDVRIDLKQWSPPELDFRVPFAPAKPSASSRWAAFIPDVPTWAQAAAAVLFLGAAAGMANLEITYGTGGLTVQTGWRHSGAVATNGRSAETLADSAPAAPSQADLIALEQRLRAELAQSSAKPVAVTASSPDDEVLLRRVRALMQESEQRQQRELALRVAEMARQVEGQRQADLQRIDRNLGIIQSRTGMEVMRTQQLFNNLAQRVSQGQEP